MWAFGAGESNGESSKDSKDDGGTVELNALLTERDRELPEVCSAKRGDRSSGEFVMAAATSAGAGSDVSPGYCSLMTLARMRESFSISCKDILTGREADDLEGITVTSLEFPLTCNWLLDLPPCEPDRETAWRILEATLKMASLAEALVTSLPDVGAVSPGRGWYI